MAFRQIRLIGIRYLQTSSNRRHYNSKTVMLLAVAIRSQIRLLTAQWMI
ncbi:hypothetical protein FOXYSP1_12978 [Fusarium oxysporum f. sp. phaseoli]